MDHAIDSPDSVGVDRKRALSEVDRALLLLVNPHNDHRQKNDVRCLKPSGTRVFLRVGTVEDSEGTSRANLGSIQGPARIRPGREESFSCPPSTRRRGKSIQEGVGLLPTCRKHESGVMESRHSRPSTRLPFTSSTYWQIQRTQVSPLGFRIEWDRVERYCRAVLSSPALAPDPFYKYLLGLSLAPPGQLAAIERHAI